MTRVMYDSIDVAQIPATARAVMGYVGPVTADNHFVTFPALVRRFKHANKLSVATHPEFSAEFLDVENGDARPADFVPWLRRMFVAGEDRPGLYASRDTVPTVIALATAAGIPRSRYRILSAHVGLGPHICSPTSCGASFTADGTQHTFKALGRNLDESLLSDTFFPPAPKHKKVKPHPKVTAATLTSLIAAAITTAVHAAGLHIDPAEAAGITTAAAALGGYFFPTKRKAKA